jgi:hypothetical protein
VVNLVVIPFHTRTRVNLHILLFGLVPTIVYDDGFISSTD